MVKDVAVDGEGIVIAVAIGETGGTVAFGGIVDAGVGATGGFGGVIIVLITEGGTFGGTVNADVGLLFAGGALGCGAVVCGFFGGIGGMSGAADTVFPVVGGTIFIGVENMPL